MNPAIRHIFVLAMENRSFDHLLAYSGLPGISAPDSAFGLTAGATDRPRLDPSHEYEDVAQQIAGDPPMSGFAQLPYAQVSLAAFPQGAVPMLRGLASEFLLFDNWFASIPGPTWPNRFFLHAGSSGGLDNSPSAVTSVSSETVDSLSFDFQHGTIFQQLQSSGRTWRVYHDDLFPQVLAIKHMIDPFRLNTSQFSWFQAPGTDCFNRDLHNDYQVDYTFLEPNYGLAGGDFSSSNCQHPLGSLQAGEAFIRYVYAAIRNSPIWPSSLLIITYDEHGGFFDHVAPPAATPPGDDARNHNRAEHPMDFAFNRFGVRVPAVAVSPWIPKGSLGSRVFPGRTFDHSAIGATLDECFALAAPLTQRAASVGSIGAACSLTAMRSDTPTSFEVPATAPANTSGAEQALSTLPAGGTSGVSAPPDHAIEAFTRIAASVDLAIAEAELIPPVASTHPLFAATPRLSSAPAEGTAALEPAVTTTSPRRRLLTDYMRAVSQRREARRSGSESPSRPGGPAK